ncbi:hypothetical protein [Ottowia testudinis]|uniref:Uncharacterized protein n=1 Tax=Ottowia testudinis TaxID=2816950 RepID=A0A975H2U3_9BURK|nr:hypothetical protein [Ottowia testudinis]QTD44565.1 hypothetical protein J1M35_15915 [Ottowia testudinis]
MSRTLVELVGRARLSPEGRHRVALALARAHDEAGGDVMVSMRSLAEAACLSKNSAREHVHALRRDGIVSVIDNAHGGAPGTAPVYRIHVPALERLAADSGDLFEQWLEDAPPGGPYTIELDSGVLLAASLRGRPGSRVVSFWRIDVEPGQDYGEVPLALLLRDPRVQGAWDGYLSPDNPFITGEPVRLLPREIFWVAEWAQSASLGRVESAVEA